MASTILQLMQETDGQSVLMVSHGGAMANLPDLGRKNWHLDDLGHMTNCGILKFTFEDDQFTLKRLLVTILVIGRENERFVFDATRPDFFNQEGFGARRLRFSFDRTGAGLGPGRQELIW